MGLLSFLGLKGTKAKKANQRVLALQERALTQQVGFFEAIGDPRGMQFQDIAGFLEQDALRDFEEGLRQVSVQNRRAVARGGGFLLNPERRDEALLSALAREREVGGTAARQQTFDILLRAAGQPSAGIGATIGRQAELGQAQAGRAASFGQFGLGLLGFGGGGGGGFGGLLGGTT